MIHPVRMSGTVIGAVQTYDYFEMIQDRILNFVSGHSQIAYDQLRRLMPQYGNADKGSGDCPSRRDAVKEGLICEVGGIREALQKLNRMVLERKEI